MLPRFPLAFPSPILSPIVLRQEKTTVHFINMFLVANMTGGFIFNGILKLMKEDKSPLGV